MIRYRLLSLHHGQVKATHWRRVRGDGNCFYRALGSTLVERMLVRTHSTNAFSMGYVSLQLNGDIDKFHDFVHHALHLARRSEKVDGMWHGLLQRDEEGYRRRVGRGFLHYTSADSPLHFWNEVSLYDEDTLFIS